MVVTRGVIEIAVGVFCTCPYSYAKTIDGDTDCGIFYGGSGELLGAQIVFILIHLAWVGTCSALIFFALKAIGILRVSVDVEEAGLDVSKHGGAAYPEQMKNSVDTAAA